MTMPAPEPTKFDLPARSAPGRTRSSPLNAVPPRPPTRNRSNDGDLLEMKRSLSKENGDDPKNGTSSVSSPRSSKPTIASSNHTTTTAESSSSSSRVSSRTPRATPRRMSNRQRMTQLAVQELSNSLSNMGNSSFTMDLNDSCSSLMSSEGSYSLNDLARGIMNANGGDNINSKSANDSHIPMNRLGSGRTSGSRHNRTSASSASDRSSRRERSDLLRSKRSSSREHSRSRHRRSIDKSVDRRSSDASCAAEYDRGETTPPTSASSSSDNPISTGHESPSGRRSSDRCSRDRDNNRSSRHGRRSIDKQLEASPSAEDGVEGDEGAETATSSSRRGSGSDRGRNRRSGDARRSSRSNSRKRGSSRSGNSSKQRSRSRSKTRETRSKSINARKHLGNNKPQRTRSGEWKDVMIKDEDFSNGGKESGSSAEFEASDYSGRRDRTTGGIDNSTGTNHSKISETDMMDFLSGPKPTRRLGDRKSSKEGGEGGSSGGGRFTRRNSAGALSSGGSGSSDRRRESRKERRERRDGRSSPHQTTASGDQSPQRPTRGQSPTSGWRGTRTPTKQKRSSSVDAFSREHRTPTRTKSGDAVATASSLEGFLNLPSRRPRSGGGAQSVASSPSLHLMSNSSRRRGRSSVADSTHSYTSRPNSGRSTSGSSNYSSSGSDDFELPNDESSECYEEEPGKHHKSLRDFNRESTNRTRKAPGQSSSCEDLGSSMGLPPKIASDSKSPGKRSAPRRTKSSGSKAGLESFLASQPGRRRPPAGSGSRSVCSGPGGAALGKTRKMKQLEEINSRYENDKTKEHINLTGSVGGSFSGGVYKPPSTRSLSGGEHLEIDVAPFGDGEEMGALQHKSFREMEKDRDMQSHLNRTDDLLYSVFPKHIAEALRAGKKVEPENHECVTIFFSDIVGFTDISSTLDPMKISDMLDRLYNSFDTLSHYHDVFKVETIGDAYMAVTNLTKDQPDHCKRIAMFAADAIRVASQTVIDVDDPSKGNVNIRVGFHSGPVVSSVVGSRNPRYCLFGDTVNTASRMESNSEVNRIHCSEDSAKILQAQHKEVRIVSRGKIDVKGKGKMNTFWVDEEVSSPKGTSSGTSKKLSNKVFNFFDKRRLAKEVS